MKCNEFKTRLTIESSESVFFSCEFIEHSLRNQQLTLRVDSLCSSKGGRHYHRKGRK